MTPAGARATKDRLLTAAAALFAEHGFHGTKIRDIAARARVNVAAGNYHYGSKKALYLAVLRAQFAEIRASLAARGATRAPSELARLGRRELAGLLRARVKVMLDILIGPPPGLHGTLMQREMCDPSEALPSSSTSSSGRSRARWRRSSRSSCRVWIGRRSSGA